MTVKKHEFFVAGKPRRSETLKPVRFPYNDEVVAQVYQAGEEALEQALVAAVRGFEITRKLPAHARARILFQLLEQLERRGDEMVEALVLEGGKTRSVAQGETARAKETIRVAAEEAKRIGGEIIPIDTTPAGEGRLGFVRHFPLGPVLGIAPFNYPLNLAGHSLAPAIAAGALASVRHLKSSQMERARHQERARTLKKRLQDAGLPVLDNPSHIVPVLVGDPVHCKQLTDALMDRFGIYVQPINYPTVPRGTERIRLTPSPQHSDEDMAHLVAALTDLWAMCPLAKMPADKLAAE